MDSSKLVLVLFLSSLLIHAALGEIVCEELPTNVCAFSISSSGKRCLLETATTTGKHENQCRTSEVVVERMANYIETDECVNACGVDRNSIGISSDSLLEPHFTSKLCSSACYRGCPNIVDLYYNLAAGEGAFLPHICEAARHNPHRSMVELISTIGVGGVAPGPLAVQSKEKSMPQTPPGEGEGESEGDGDGDDDNAGSEEANAPAPAPIDSLDPESPPPEDDDLPPLKDVNSHN